MKERPSSLHTVIVMGVAGVGKTAVGRVLALRLGWDFVDADDLHDEANRRKMAGGVPLDDDDRRPWLDRLRELIDQRRLEEDRGMVLACSALKEAYRRRLGVGAPGVALVYLKAEPALIESRLRRRTGHYMPPSLLTSQLAALEPPLDAIDVSTAPELEVVVDEILAALPRAGADRAGATGAAESGG